MSSIIAKLRFPISKQNIIPCTNIACICVEYLDLNNKKQFEKYKQCMITNINNKEKQIFKPYDLKNFK